MKSIIIDGVEYELTPKLPSTSTQQPDLSGKIVYRKPEESQYDGAKLGMFVYDEPGQYITPNPRETFEKNKKFVIQSQQPEPEKKDVQPSSNTEKHRIKFSKEISDFIQITFNAAYDNWYWTDFFFKKVGEYCYEAYSANELPDHLKKLIQPKINYQKQMDEAITLAWEAACVEMENYVSNKYKGDYPNPKKYIQSINQKQQP